MKFLTAQSDNDYNIWQLQVQMYNFKKFGIEDKAIVLIGYNPSIGVSGKALEFKEMTSAMVLFIPDKRALSDRLYTPSIRPHLIKQLYQLYPHLLENKAVLFLDCDVIFTKLPFVKELISKRKIYVSEISKYTSIKLDQNLQDGMCKIVGISPKMVKRNESGMGGAQYLFNSSLNFSYEFWEKIEHDSNNIYKLLLVSSEQYGQDIVAYSWSADMWAIIWNIWLLGVDTEITDEMSFTVASSPISQLDQNNIYHNAGVDSISSNFLFDKKLFTDKSPFETDLSYVDKNYCSYFYVREIIDASKYYIKKH